MSRFLPVLFLLLATQATAQAIGPIDMRLDRLVPGTRDVYESSDSGVYELTYSHGENGGFVIEQHSRETPETRTLVMTIHTDRIGRWLRQVGADGTEIRFEPHNCLRSLVYCEYSAIINDQPGFPLSRQATLTDEGLRYEMYRRDLNPPQLIQSGTVVLDGLGLMESSSLSRPGGGTQTIRRIETLVPGRSAGPLPEPSIILR